MVRICKIVLLFIALGAMPAVAADHAVIFAYHRFGEDTVPATNVRLAQFDAHLAYLEEGGFNVWPLSRVVRHLKAGMPLPERTVALTADDAYRSVMTQAWPRLKRRGWTMTLFVATDGVDQRIRGYLSWDEIRALQADGMEIGAHSAAHGHMAEMDGEKVAGDFARARERFIDELGAQPDLLAWPYGEASQEGMRLAQDAGYLAAFGQHSGPTHAGQDFFMLSRFAMNEAYGRPERFKLAANTLPLRVTGLQPADLLLIEGSYPEIAFTLLPGPDPKSVRCYHSSSSTAQVPVVDGRRLSFRPAGQARPGRSRYNCTAAAGKGRFYWHGRQFVTPGGRD